MNLGKKTNTFHLIGFGLMNLVFLFALSVGFAKAEEPTAPPIPSPTVPAGGTEVKGVSVKMCSSDPTTFTVGNSATLSYEVSSNLNYATDCTKNYAGSVVTPSAGTTTYYTQCVKPDGIGGKYEFTACVNLTANKILTGTCGCSASKGFDSQPPESTMCATGSVSNIQFFEGGCDAKGNCWNGTWTWRCGYADATHSLSVCSAWETPLPNNRGACGAADGGTYLNAAAVTAAGRCASGTASAVTLSGETFSWTCTGTAGCWNDSCSATKTCVPNNSCAANTCVGQTCTDSCGILYNGTKAVDNSCAANTCIGQTCTNNCGIAISGTKNDASCCTAWSAWTPSTATVCTNTTLTQTRTCIAPVGVSATQTQIVFGTKLPAWPPDPFDPTTKCAGTSCVSQSDGCGGVRDFCGTKTTYECCPTKACGTANGVPTTVKPTTNLCADGAIPTVTDTGASWIWTCPNSCEGAILQNCSAPHTLDFKLRDWRETAP